MHRVDSVVAGYKIIGASEMVEIKFKGFKWMKTFDVDFVATGPVNGQREFINEISSRFI